MPVYASDLGTIFPGTPLEKVLKKASLTPQQAAEAASVELEMSSDLRAAISLEDLTLLLREAGERSLYLGALVRGEIATLTKVKGGEIAKDPWAAEWEVTLPSGSLTFGQMEDYSVLVFRAKLNR
jgi:hypothetical protein